MNTINNVHDNLYIVNVTTTATPLRPVAAAQASADGAADAGRDLDGADVAAGARPAAAASEAPGALRSGADDEATAPPLDARSQALIARAAERVAAALMQQATLTALTRVPDDATLTALTQAPEPAASGGRAASRPLDTVAGHYRLRQFLQTLGSGAADAAG